MLYELYGHETKAPPGWAALLFPGADPSSAPLFSFQRNRIVKPKLTVRY